VGADPLDFVHPDDRRRAVEASEVARKTGRATGTAIRYRHVDTSYRCLSWSGYRARVGWHIFARDVSAARAIEVERL
jgi:hypothetical protein